MSRESEKKRQPTSLTEFGVKRRGLLRFGTLITAFSGASAISAIGATSAQAGPGDKTPPSTYVPIAEKGAPSGVATLDSASKILPVQIPDLSATYATPATIIPKWTAVTAYTSGQQVITPNGDVVSAIANHTSGPSFTPANWNYVRFNDYFANVKSYGAKGDGSTNDTVAIEAAIAAMPSITAYGTVSGVLYFPAGLYVTDGGHVVTTKRMQVRGAGPYVSILAQRSGVTADILTISAANSGISAMSLCGTRTNASGDALVLNSAYTYARNVTINSPAGNGITVGKAGRAIVHRINDVNIRSAKGYGIQVVDSSGSTDGQWSNIDIGQTGLSAVRIQTGAQMLTNVHVWLSGLESTTDKHGFWLSSTSTQLIGCQSETNLGNGVHINPSGSNGQMIIGCKLWGNRGAGIYGFSSARITVVGNEIYRNGLDNPGAASGSFAGIFNDGGSEWTVSGNNIWDDNTAIPAATLSSATYSFPGRDGKVHTQSYAYYEGTNADYNAVSGNSMQCRRTRSGKSHLSIGAHNQWAGNNLGSTAVLPTVAAATTITLPSDCDLIQVTGSASIANINLGQIGRRVTLMFSDTTPGTMANGVGTLRLAGSFTPTQNDTITLICGATEWHETCRSGDV